MKIKASEAVIGRFYEVQGKRRLFIGRSIYDQMFADSRGSVSLFDPDDEITPLAVTNWTDEPAPAHPPVPEGWRLIDKEKDAPKQPTDRYWSKDQERWVQISSPPMPWFCSGDLYIRRITPETPDPGDGWRIASGEDWRDERCEVWAGVPESVGSAFWDERQYPGKPFNPNLIYRVPIAPAYRPFETQEEVEPFIGTQVCDSDGSKFLVTGAGKNGVAIGCTPYTHQEAFDNYKQLDGTPFGVKVSP